MTRFATKHSKFGVGGCWRLDLFLLNKIFLQEVLDVKNTFGRQVCCFWARNSLKVEKNEIWAESADQKHINNLPLARQFALTAVEIDMFGGKTRHV